MKQEEFEWLKNWLTLIHSIEGAKPSEGKEGKTFSIFDAINLATEQLPPPIGEGIDTGCVFGPTKVCAGGEEPDCNRECDEEYKTLEQQITELWKSRGMEVLTMEFKTNDNKTLQWTIRAKETPK